MSQIDKCLNLLEELVSTNKPSDGLDTMYYGMKEYIFSQELSKEQLERFYYKCHYRNYHREKANYVLIEISEFERHSRFQPNMTDAMLVWCIGLMPKSTHYFLKYIDKYWDEESGKFLEKPIEKKKTVTQVEFENLAAALSLGINNAMFTPGPLAFDIRPDLRNAFQGLEDSIAPNGRSLSNILNSYKRSGKDEN